MENETETSEQPDTQDEPQPSRQERRDARFREKYEAEKQARERVEQELAARDEAAGDFEKLAKRLERQAAEITKERDEAKAGYEGLLGKLRTDALVERIAAASGVESRARIAGLIAVAETDLDRAPERVTDRDVRSWIKELQALDPGAFEHRAAAKKGSPAPGMRRSLAPGEQPDRRPWEHLIDEARAAHGGRRKW